MTEKNLKPGRERGLDSMRAAAGMFAVTVFIATLSLLSACTTTPPASPGDAVRDRAEARWAALLSNDYEGAYAFYSPGYRETTTLIDFAMGVRLRKVQWTASEYRDHSCEESVCKVRFNITYQAQNPVPGLEVWEGDSPAEETWIFSEGNWWYLSSE